MLKYWDLWATIAGLIVVTAWVTIKYHHKCEYHPLPSFSDSVDTIACIGILIVVTHRSGRAGPGEIHPP